MDTAVADRAGADAEGDLHEEAEALRRMLVRFGPPDGANTAERNELTALQSEGRECLAPPLDRGGLDRAARVVERMRDPHEHCLRRISRDRILGGCEAQQALAADLLAHDAREVAGRLEVIRGRLTEIAPRQVDLDTGADELSALTGFVEAARARAEADKADRKARAVALRDAAAAVRVAHADDAEAARIVAAARAVSAGWSDPPTWDRIESGEGLLAALEALAAKIARDVESRAVARRELMRDIAGIAVEGADGDEAARLSETVENLTAGLPEHPSGAELDAARAGLKALHALAASVQAAVDARIARRDAVLSALADCRPDGMIASEADRMDAAEGRLPDLSGVPSAAVLDAAEAALSDLGQVADGIRAAVAVRVALAARFAALARQSVWGEGDLVPDAEAPPGLFSGIKARAEALIGELDLLGDPARVDAWPETDADRLEAMIAEAEAGRAGMVAEIAAANSAWRAVGDRRAQVLAGIEAAGTHKLSGLQRSALGERVEAACAILSADPSEAEAALSALDRVAGDTRMLQRGLRGLAQRIAAVDMSPALASKPEIARLEALRDKALADLAKAMP